ncbi:hypothetical protein Pint_26371 [Pistacia integerrima]|uniref:Uncharacterized protein n=1 Tax=Pistacia integerrima TaxID=434235 RepID=A0ACC0YDW0_9ROSI|nr:hypothetical protein Pint_26371 [Pistacia integerrima]
MAAKLIVFSNLSLYYTPYPIDNRSLQCDLLWCETGWQNRLNTLLPQGLGCYLWLSSGVHIFYPKRKLITFNWVNKIQIGLTSINSLAIHLVINSCNNVIVRNVKLIAPDESPNIDGIRIQSSTGVTITGSILQTGDDCISIDLGTRNLLMDNIKCGPGHGIT